MYTTLMKPLVLFLDCSKLLQSTVGLYHIMNMHEHVYICVLTWMYNMHRYTYAHLYLFSGVHICVQGGVYIFVCSGNACRDTGKKRYIHPSLD